MCIMRPRVDQVSGTRILARMVAPGRQALAYEMSVAATTEVAMILPVPVPPGSPEDAVDFISLERYATLFDDLHRPFAAASAGVPARNTPRSAPLRVHEVGAFRASFAPRVADLDRLDPQFRLPPSAIDAVPAYADWGFVVFQLAPERTPTRVHPMAFTFPTRKPTQLFFPTIHIHDGELHEQANFHHALFAQGIDEGGFTVSPEPAERFVDRARAGVLVDGDAPVWHRPVHGLRPNADIWARVSA